MSRRISTQRLELRAADFTARDRELITMLARTKLATGNQLRRAVLADNSPAAQRAARRELARLVRWRIVARLERRQGGLGRGSDSFTYALDIGAQRLLHPEGTARRPNLPRPAMWRHALLGAEIYTRLVEALRGSERRLVQWDGEPACWRDYTTGYGEAQRLKPDAFACVRGGGWEDLTFLEVDTGSQSRPVIRQKLRAYVRYAATNQEQSQHGGVFPRVTFITSSPERHAVLVDLFAELSVELWPLFAIGLVDDAARLLSGGST